MATVIEFFTFDSDEWKEIPMGTVTIDGSTITSDNPDLLEIVEPGTSEEAAKGLFADWSNGYIGSRIQSSLIATGRIALGGQE